PGNHVNEAPGNYDNEEAPMTIIILKVIMSLVNAFEDLEVIPNESSNVLAEHDQNILEMDLLKNKTKAVEKDEHKRKGVENLKKNKEFVEKFLTDNTFNNCTFNF
ncbi:9028_t:CDS:2, partial [Dentiscutata erythropus]